VQVVPFALLFRSSFSVNAIMRSFSFFVFYVKSGFFWSAVVDIIIGCGFFFPLKQHFECVLLPCFINYGLFRRSFSCFLVTVPVWELIFPRFCTLTLFLSVLVSSLTSSFLHFLSNCFCLFLLNDLQEFKCRNAIAIVEQYK
jgi:hypothetical protein